MSNFTRGLHPLLVRRQLLKLGVATTGAGLLAAKRGSAVAKGGSSDLPLSPPTTPFVVPLPVSPPKPPLTKLDPVAEITTSVGEVARPPHQRWQEFLPQKFYELHVTEALHSFHPELP